MFWSWSCRSVLCILLLSLNPTGSLELQKYMRFAYYFRAQHLLEPWLQKCALRLTCALDRAIQTGAAEVYFAYYDHTYHLSFSSRIWRSVLHALRLPAACRSPLVCYFRSTVSEQRARWPERKFARHHSSENDPTRTILAEGSSAT